MVCIPPTRVLSVERAHGISLEKTQTCFAFVTHEGYDGMSYPLMILRELIGLHFVTNQTTAHSCRSARLMYSNSTHVL